VDLLVGCGSHSQQEHYAHAHTHSDKCGQSKKTAAWTLRWAHNKQHIYNRDNVPAQNAEPNSASRSDPYTRCWTEAVSRCPWPITDNKMLNEQSFAATQICMRLRLFRAYGNNDNLKLQSVKIRKVWMCMATILSRSWAQLCTSAQPRRDKG
jgi:hypothetical protein